MATRPLSLRKNGTWYTYGHDLTKNVTELYKADGTIATAYDYTPYGAVTATGIDQPIQWSSEHYDPELALVYYNYRHYNPLDGRWINRDSIAEEEGYNVYGFVRNRVIGLYDVVGQSENSVVPLEDVIDIMPPKYLLDGVEIIPPVGAISERDIRNFFSAVRALKSKNTDGLPCYRAVNVYGKGAATMSQIIDSKCDEIYIVAHGDRFNDREVVFLKDGVLFIDKIRQKGIQVHPYGCYIGGNEGLIYSNENLRKLTSDLYNRYNDRNDCCLFSTICFFFGPSNINI